MTEQTLRDFVGRWGLSPGRLESTPRGQSPRESGQVLKVKWTQDALGYRFHVTTLSGETCCRAAIENADS